MKSNGTKKITLIVLMACILALTAVFTVMSFAKDENDAMNEITAAFSDKQIGEKVRLENDGYIGIPVELTTYYDYATFGPAKTGYYGTNIALYFVNTNVERIGTETDVNIISSMLERGYAVVVVDYLNSKKAKSPDIDFSSQIVRVSATNGTCFTDKTVFPSGTYYDTHVVPAGYDVTPFATFWSLDKHGAEGSLDRIVDVWNTDFRSSKGNSVIEWIREEVVDGKTVYVQKATQTAFDGTEPQWYSDAKGTTPVSATSPDAKYIKAKHTLALDITDCVAKDGTALDLDLEMHIVYPVNPESPVPVMMLSGSSGYLSTARTSSNLRPHTNGYLFEGYAGVVYEHLWIPMANDEYYSSFDGNAKNGGVSKDNVSYSVFSYNSQRVDTAAVRYIKYLTYTEPDKYSFDTDAVGVMGNSKGGMFIFIGSAELREYTTVPEGMTLSEAIDARINAYVPSRIYAGKTGESRYQYGITEDYTIDGITIRGGEMQPWMTYVDENGVEREILASTSFVYAANGSNVNHIKEGHAPIFTAMCTEDPLGNGYASSNQIANAARSMDIPCLYLVVDIGHTFAEGPDAYYDINSYVALFDFSNYYLRGDAVKVIYTDPVSSLSGMDTTTPITVKFSGTVTASEIAKITLVDSNGNAVFGEWTSSYGGNEWSFSHEALRGGEKYTLTVPKGFAGDNGRATEEDYTATYITAPETSEKTTSVRTVNGTYFTVSYADMTAVSEAKIRFSVENDAANAVGLYLVNSFNATNPDASTVGSCLGTVYLMGKGYYEVDVSSVAGELSPGESVTMLLKTEKAVGTTEKSINFANELSALGDYKYMIAESSEAPNGTKAAKITLTTNVASDGTYQYLNTEYYPANASILNTWRAFISSSQKVTDADMGRKFTATLRVYDTISRSITVTMNNATSSTYETMDFNYVYFTVETKANEWTEIEVDYTVYEKLFGTVGSQGKRLTFSANGDGVKQSPIYISTLTTVETVTDVTFGDVSLVLTNRDGKAYKKAEADSPFSIGDNYYSTLSAALSAYKSGEIIKLNKNYTLTTADNSTAYGNFESVIIDLSGHKLYSESTNSTFTLGSGSKNVKTTLTVQNGSIFTGNAPIIGYSSSYTSGKAFDVIFDNVSILATDGSAITKVMSASEISNGATANVKIILNECLVKLEKERIVYNPVTVFAGGSENLNISYVLNGGRIVTDSFVRVSLYDDYRDVVLNEKGGAYTTIEVPSARSIPEIWAVRTSDIATYTVRSVENGIATLETVTNPNATKYGIFPAEYADAEEYPFMLFDSNGTFIGAYKEFLSSAGALEGARALNKNNAYDGASYAENAISGIILVRRDYTLSSTEKYENLAQLQGEVTIDLSGFTLTQSTTWTPILNAASKGWNSAPGKPVFPTTVKIINGTLLTYKCGVVVMSTWESVGNGAIAGKQFDLIFENVTLGFAEGAEAATLLTTYNNPVTTGDRTLAAPFGLTFNDCTFDLTNRNTAKSGTLFSTATSGKFIDVDITVNGCKIVTNDLKNLDIINPVGDYTSSVTFGKGSDGKYLTLEINKGASVGEETFVTERGEEKSLTLISSDGITDIYTLDENPLKTPYGTIPETYADTSLYPIVAFEKTSSGYTFIDGYSELGAATKALLAKGTYNKHYVSYLRDNANASTFSDSNNLTGSYTVDLNGYELTLNTYSVFYIKRNYTTTADRATYSIINGTVNIAYNYGSVLGVEYGNSCEGSFRIPVVFDNVTFVSTASAPSYGLFRNVESCYSTVKDQNLCITVDVTINDCTFDYASSTKSVQMLNMSNSSGYDRIKYNVTVNGGSIVAKSGFSYAQLIDANGNENGRADTVVFGCNAEGKYVELLLPVGAAAPSSSEKYVTADGKELPFVKTSSRDGYDVYTVAEPKAPTNTKYGPIDDSFSNADEYPVIAFEKTDSGYIFIGGYTEVGAATKALLAVGTYYKHYVLLLRNDATVSTLVDANGLTGSYTIDLDGHELTVNTYSLFYIKRNYTTTADRATYSVLNGTINMAYNSGAVLGVEYGNSCEGSFKIPVIFDNVTFVSTASKPTYGIFRNVESCYSTVKDQNLCITVDVTFNGCTFDYKNSVTSVPMLSMSNASGYDRIKYNVTVNGGTIVSSTALTCETLAVLDGNANGRADSVSFTGDVKLLITKESANLGAISFGDGTHAFLKVGIEGEYAVYKLSENDLSTIVPKLSVSMFSDFILNVYVPKRDDITAALIGSELYDFKSLEIVTIEGCEYYKLTVELPAAMATEEFTLTLKISLNDGSLANGKWPMSIPSYAKKVVNDENASNIEKTLVKDMLSYVLAAYGYFNSEKYNEAKATVEAIIGNYAKDFVFDTNTSDTSSAMTSATMHLGAEPSFIFYPKHEGSYVFKQDGKTLKKEVLTDDKGISYYKVYTYAYGMAKTVSFSVTVNGSVYSGEYGIADYYAYAKTLGDEKLVTLVEKLIEYSKSAEVYRLYAIANEK